MKMNIEKIEIQLFLKKITAWNWVAAYHTHLDTCVSDLGIISDIRDLFDAYQFDTDEIQIKLICRSNTQAIKFFSLKFI